MKSDWAGVVGAALIGAATLVWTVYSWRQQRAADRQEERRRIDSLYVNPFLFAAEDLQSRLFNLLDLAGLAALNRRPGSDHAEETLYLIARYFAWEQLLLRFTHFAADAEVIRSTQAIRSAWASDRDGIDPWCLFRPKQAALGQSILVWLPGETGLADTRSFVDFKTSLADGLGKALNLEEALSDLRGAVTIDELPKSSRQRMANVQAQLVVLLEGLERKLTIERKREFTVRSGRSRQTSRMAQDSS